MGEVAEFCQYPGDTEGCRRSLIQAGSVGSIGRHCIIEGLRANWHRCQQVLLEGLYDKTSPRKSSAGKVIAAVGQKKDLEEVCKQVVLLGHPLEIKAIGAVFYEAYYKLVGSIIRKLGIKDNGQPSAEDISQAVFANLLEHFRRGARVESLLTAYIARVTVHACFRALRDAAKHTSLPKNQVRIATSLSTALLPSPVVECWEDIDQQLLRLKQGDVISRTIVAQQCLEACSTGKRPSARQLMADWQSLSKMSEQDVGALHKKIVMSLKRSPGRSVIHIAADLINAGLMRPYQIAIVFAAATGMDLEQTNRLLAQISSLSATAVYARICRIYMALAPPWTQGEQ